MCCTVIETGGPAGAEEWLGRAGEEGDEGLALGLGWTCFRQEWLHALVTSGGAVLLTLNPSESSSSAHSVVAWLTPSWQERKEGGGRRGAHPGKLCGRVRTCREAL